MSILLTDCPKCIEEKIDPPGQLKRLINSTSKGVVELTGNDLTDSVKAAAKQLERDAGRNEKLYSNLVGEKIYETKQRALDKAKKERY